MAELRLGTLNYVVIMGRATREVELKYTPKGNATCNLSIAVNRRYQDKETQEWKDDASFFNATVWGQQAERCAERIKKGSAVLIEGSLRSRSWTNQAGEKRSVVEIYARRVQILDKMGAEPEVAAVPDEEVDETHIVPENVDDLPF